MFKKKILNSNKRKISHLKILYPDNLCYDYHFQKQSIASYSLFDYKFY